MVGQEIGIETDNPGFSFANYGGDINGDYQFILLSGSGECFLLFRQTMQDERPCITTPEVIEDSKMSKMNILAEHGTAPWGHMSQRGYIHYKPLPSERRGG